MSLYELGKKDPDTETINKLADYFEVSVDYLLGRTNFRNFDENNHLTNEELEILEKIKSDPEISILFHDLKHAPPSEIKKLVKTWDFIKEQFREMDEERNASRKN